MVCAVKWSDLRPGDFLLVKDGTRGSYMVYYDNPDLEEYGNGERGWLMNDMTLVRLSRNQVSKEIDDTLWTVVKGWMREQT